MPVSGRLPRPVLLLAALLVGCPSPPPEGGEADADGEAGPTLSERRAALVAADRAAAAAATDEAAPDALVAAFAPDGFVARGGDPVARGPEASLGVFRSDTVLAGGRAAWRPVRWDVSADGSRGYTFGFLDVARPGGAAWGGKYTAWWRRAEDGRWRVVGYRYGPRPPGEVSDTPPAGFAVPSADAYPSWPGDTASIREAVASAEVAFSDRAAEVGPGAAFAEYVAPDGTHFGGGPGFAFGADAVRAMFADFPGDRGFSWHPDLVDVAPSGDLALSTGPVTAFRAGPDGPVDARPGGRYFSVWRRLPDGRWRWVIDG